jgi:hypothetical protein
MNTTFVIGNGESRRIFPIENLKGKGIIYGCNAIYRDYPHLCDRIFCLSPEMYKELEIAKTLNQTSAEIIGSENISDWNYKLPDDDPDYIPEGLTLYQRWQGGDVKRDIYKVRDFTKNRGSGCSAVLHAAEQGQKNICILGFDIVGARQWEMPEGETSRIQNNIYANTPNYPVRFSMKAYMKFEWLYHLTQIFRRFPETNFYFFNRREYIDHNPYLRPYFRYAPGNIRVGIYADLMKYINGETIAWKIF